MKSWLCRSALVLLATTLSLLIAGCGSTYQSGGVWFPEGGGVLASGGSGGSAKPRPGTPEYREWVKRNLPAYEAPLSSFPWPAPLWSARLAIDMGYFESVSTVGALGNRLSQALDIAGYYERSYFSVPGGIAIATRLEQIDENAQPSPGDARWSGEPYRAEFSLAWYLSTLLKGRSGSYRVIVLVLTDEAIDQHSGPPDEAAAGGWLKSGPDVLPSHMGFFPLNESHRVTALVYEFDAGDAAGTASVKDPSAFAARTHLVEILRGLDDVR